MTPDETREMAVRMLGRDARPAIEFRMLTSGDTGQLQQKWVGLGEAWLEIPSVPAEGVPPKDKDRSAAWMAGDVDATRDYNTDAIRRLCERVGYGFVMQTAADLWREKDPIGALTVGPCVGMAAPKP